MRSSLGRQVLSTNPQVIAAVFQKGKRPELKSTNNDVGPSQYDQAKMDKALALKVSTFHRPPTIKFGTEPARPDYGFSSVTKNVNFAKLPPAIGKQVLSKSRSAPRVLMAGRVNLLGIALNQAGRTWAMLRYARSVGPQVSLPSVHRIHFLWNRTEGRIG